MTFLQSRYNPRINLSADEILEISEEISRNFAPCFSSGMPGLGEKIRFSSKELLEIGDVIGRDFAPKATHHIPEVVLLPVDPGHLYAYWDLGESPEISASDNESNNPLTLRIYSLPEDEQVVTETAAWFDVAIDSPNTRQQVSLPSPVDDTVYSAAIGKCCEDNGFIAFAHSEIIHTPHSLHVRSAWHQYKNSTRCVGKSASGLGLSRQT